MWGWTSTTPRALWGFGNTATTALGAETNNASDDGILNPPLVALPFPFNFYSFSSGICGRFCVSVWVFSECCQPQRHD
ncbi:hypothetical protein VTN00DRAFT_2116 [Thermoascus crustaceus]|uniref:uncharacterized protein n=1 Tax=Thermoascus crustaceus TaxID=5088 RepID=UPI0037448E98